MASGATSAPRIELRRSINVVFVIRKSIAPFAARIVLKDTLLPVTALK
jgi:hypothetical protein